MPVSQRRGNSQRRSIDRAVYTGSVPRVPNKRGAGQRLRTFWCSDEEWAAIKAAAEYNGETITDVILRSLRAYVKRTDKKRQAAP